MTKKFNIGDLACYKRNDLSEDAIAIILYTMFQDQSGIEYFRCLINGSSETICEVWLYET